MPHVVAEMSKTDKVTKSFIFTLSISYSIIRAATLKNAEFCFLKWFSLFFFLWTRNNELENVAHSVPSFYFQLINAVFKIPEQCGLWLLMKLKIKQKSPQHSCHPLREEQPNTLDKKWTFL